MAIYIRRREFIVTLGGAAVGGPLAARAQPPMPMIGFMNSRSPEDSGNALAAFLIKGAYTQSRLRQMIFGGTTRYTLSNAVLPALLAH
jgi:hypothetical protein